MPWRKQLLSRLTAPVATLVASLDEEEAARMEELRIRTRQPVELVIDGLRRASSVVLDDVQMEALIAALTGCSLYAYERQMARGYIPLPGGHRAGVTGRMAAEPGKASRMSAISSVCIRIARHIERASEPVRPYLLAPGGQVQRTLLIGPPGCGKTTVLRDAALYLSDTCGKHVAVADEREELFPQERPPGQGERLDVLSGLDKAEALPLLVRAMAPDVLITDEIGSAADALALADAARCGVGLLATAHAGSLEELMDRPALRRIAHGGVFERVVLLGARGTCQQVWNGAYDDCREATRHDELECGGDGDDRHQCHGVFVCGG